MNRRDLELICISLQEAGPGLLDAITGPLIFKRLIDFDGAKAEGADGTPTPSVKYFIR